MTEWYETTPVPRRPGPRFDPLDPRVAGTTTTTSMPGSRELVRCAHCGDVGLFRAEDLPGIWHGSSPVWCAACIPHAQRRAA